MIQSTMPMQQVKPLPGGSIYTAAMADGNAQTKAQMDLIGHGKTGGKKRYMRGGVPLVQVPPVPAGTVNSGATANNYKELTALAQLQSSQSVFDTAKTPSQTANIAAQQQTQQQMGGNRQMGGTNAQWGCYSGGLKLKQRKRIAKKKTNKKRTNKKRKTNNKTKRRKR